MQKNEMIIIDSSLINEENKSHYLEFYETIFETINETFRCLYYIDGIKESFGNYFKPRGYKYEYFFKDIVKMLNQKICINIWKLLLDKGKDSLSIYKMKAFLRNTFNHTISKKNIYINPNLEKSVCGMRNAFISHNLHTEVGYTIDTRDLKPLLFEIYAYFQKLWIQNFVDSSLFISDGYFEGLEQLYKDSVKEAFQGIIPL